MGLLIEGQAWQIPFCGTRPGASCASAGGFARIGVEQHAQPGNGALVEVAFATHIADPGGKIRDHDELATQPREIGDVSQMHHAGCALPAWRGIEGRGGERLRLIHRVLNAS